ncbi:MAG: FHA domain-containing protein [Planctomycetota bacterium]|nr:FHA domain-containing protein [Planctomycetota bacterium]
MLRLKQIECSLASGRLDEAFDLARRPDVRTHRRGQELISRLIASFVDRGRGHLAAGQLVQAKVDCDKAQQLGGNLADVVQLQSDISQEIHGKDQVSRQCAQAVIAARQHAERGQLSMGQQILAGVATADPRVDGLKVDLANRRAAFESCFKKSCEALAGGNWQGAIDLISNFGKVVLQDSGLRDLCGKISEIAVAEVAQAMELGRPDSAGALLKALERLPLQSLEAEQYRKVLEQCHAAYVAIQDARPREAEEILRRLKALCPKATWLALAAEQAKQSAEMMGNIRTSPLSLIALTTETVAAMPAGNAFALPGAMKAIRPMPSAAKYFCLHVDGVGSFAVSTGANVSVGPVSSSRQVDFPLMMDAGAPVISISRSEEDYFLKSTRPVLVNDNPVTHRLLNNGDRISMGSRCRITFRRPSAASTSAVLDLSGTRLPDSGVRQVVLMDRELIIGPGASAHIRADDLPAPVVIQRRGDALVCRCVNEITIDGSPAGRTAEVLPGANVAVGPLRFVIARENGA